MSYKMIKWGSSSNSNEKDEYFMDVNAFMETRVKARKEGFKHYWHDHLLELREVFLDSTKDVICNGCGLFIRGCAYYTCSTLHCIFHLHEFCAHLPQNMTHLILDKDKCQHIHKLTPIFVGNSFFTTYCSLCNEVISLVYFELSNRKKDRLGYRCSEDNCKFRVDLRCVASVFAVKDPGHLHTLTPRLCPASFLCSICGEKNDDKESLFYICNECPFLVHDSCYPLPRTIQHPTHPHPLRMRDIHSKNGWLKCGICKKSVEKKYWWYECPACSYTLHVQCSFRKRNEMVLPKLNEEEVKSMIKLSFPHKKSVHQTLTQLVRKLCNSEEEEEESSSDNNVLHHPNHDCPLVICETNADNSQVCDACVLPIYEPPFYACHVDSCKFFLHKWCANLPKELKITHHEYPEHTFVLVEKKTGGYDFHICKICDKVGNGFFFKCTDEDCEDYYIDIKCASLPNSVMHDTHEHPLLLRKIWYQPDTSQATCYCCVRSTELTYVYGCDSCNVFLHVRCLWIPQKMEYWYDEHPFSLVFNWPKVTSGDGSDDYFCELCEITINDYHGFYHCSECDQSTHICCIGRDLYPMLRFGHSYEFSDIHQHPLTCVMGTSCVMCSFCGDFDPPDPDFNKDLYMIRGLPKKMIFECLICKISLHPHCVDNALSSEEDEELSEEEEKELSEEEEEEEEEEEVAII